MSEDNQIEVWIKYKDLEKKVTGNKDTVIREVISFLSTNAPNLEFISKLTLTIDEEQFLNSCSQIMKLTPEGVVVTVPTENLTDRELILLYLTRTRFGYLTKNLDSDRAIIGDLISHTKKSAGTGQGAPCIEITAPRGPLSPPWCGRSLALRHTGSLQRTSCPGKTGQE